MALHISGDLLNDDVTGVIDAWVKPSKAFRYHCGITKQSDDSELLIAAN
jgi:hypothetical protein